MKTPLPMAGSSGVSTPRSTPVFNTAPHFPTEKRPHRRRLGSWILRWITAAILFQTLFFKFSGARESVYIFSTLGLEPWGRLGSGAVELVAVILLLTPRAFLWGAMISLGVITGAIVSHLTRLGIVVQGDGGLLFGLALVVFIASLALMVLHRGEWWKATTGWIQRRKTAAGTEGITAPPSNGAVGKQG